MKKSNLLSMKKTLYEVSIIRPIVIFLLVVLHAFTQLHYSSGNEVNTNVVGGDYQLVSFYYWMLKIIQGFRIETITFIAGYVFAFQSIELGKKYDFGPFLCKKFKRLIIPYIVFGLIYFFAFVYQKDFSWITFVKSGYPVGHLWFLPMLFWVFILLWAYDHYNIDSKLVFVGLMLLSAIPISLPFNIIGLMRLPHFVFYCILGYVVFKYKNQICNKWMTIHKTAFLWGIYIILVIIYNSITDDKFQGTVMLQYAMSLTKMIMRLLICCSGIMALYLTVIRIVSKTSYKPSSFTLKASGLCYGVYVYHQFILQIINRYVPLSDYVGYYMLPWVGLAITLLFSVLLTHFTLKTKVGRLLIG